MLNNGDLGESWAATHAKDSPLNDDTPLSRGWLLCQDTLWISCSGPHVYLSSTPLSSNPLTGPHVIHSMLPWPCGLIGGCHIVHAYSARQTTLFTLGHVNPSDSTARCMLTGQSYHHIIWRDFQLWGLWFLYRMTVRSLLSHSNDQKLVPVLILKVAQKFSCSHNELQSMGKCRCCGGTPFRAGQCVHLFLHLCEIPLAMHTEGNYIVHCSGRAEPQEPCIREKDCALVHQAVQYKSNGINQLETGDLSIHRTGRSFGNF